MFRLFTKSTAIAVVVAVVALLGGFFAGPASAHSARTGASPEDGASLDTAPDRVTLTFNEDLQTAYATLKVVGPDGHFWQKGEPTVDGRDISVPIDGLGPAGEYKVNFRVTSADGHPVQGQTTFTLTTAGEGTPGAVVPEDYETPSESEGGVKAWYIIVPIVVVVLLVGAGLAFVLVRRRS
ncbi:copper resistance protein CopC [Gordonia sp. HY002]|uniref:copper resistance CopC family protein n=1 Tax=Gordonia zhenghanii TaxID=2911516 RepID=UPI001EF02187|nr:copper resistance CopC family protein [Gordonia zhenghanii]MCF8568890.1 copper resistance protein CopC [Gordonia zhenghanii]MCF8607969.1 copper resistance protein CopC [Gordonia zhenghanii]